MSFQPNPPPDPAAQWRKIQHIGLCPGISSFEIYTDTYVPQLEQAINESIAVAWLVPGLDEIRAFHKIVFNGIHEWAGTFRGAGESVNFDGGQIGADHHRIVPAIEKVQAETTTLIETSANIGEKVRAVVMYLGALRCIHPFRDGNTRTAVVIMEGQVAALFGPREREPVASFDFKNLLRNAYQGHVGPLANRILEREGLPPLAAEDSEVAKALPALDVDMETAWQMKREEILQKQRGSLG